jgi:hypothetical protein
MAFFLTVCILGDKLTEASHGVLGGELTSHMISAHEFMPV